MSQYLADAIRWVEHLGPRDWLLAFGAMIIVAFLCMRGFGSRTNY